MRYVSIHAPWEGCDVVEGDRLPALSVSIHAPWEGCDSILLVKRSDEGVSIHAPWEGCDWGGPALCKWTFEFQFTHPGKGATISR